MDAVIQQADILARLPRSPYPGLRPFLDYEEMLMFGRKEQVNDVVRRLRESRFVAVIGGSGSGKSSLLRAGVVPHLRRYGIPAVGDLWLHVVFTPGTNAAPTGERQTTPTPLDRLAWKFDALLVETDKRDERRREIAALLRRPGGLARIVDAYAPDFDLPEGIDRTSARVLFVVDQFEELFDKSNHHVEDTARLIDRVIDHFHQSRKHPDVGRCFVALTMRSEHLNDCAGYLGLPEAINTSFYLVSRLTEDEIEQAIDGPAQRYLRLQQRLRPDPFEFVPAVLERFSAELRRVAEDPSGMPALLKSLVDSCHAACRREGIEPHETPARIDREDAAADGIALPWAVRIEPQVVERMEADARQAASDSGRLPLLLQGMARTWFAACERQKVGLAGIPEDIVFADLRLDWATLPDAVQFEAGVVDRLLEDAKSIAHDPDHLPLLQHALARLWDAAVSRERLGTDGVPARLTLADLAMAGSAVPAELPLPAADGSNILRSSLENWAERIFNQHSEQQQRDLETMLRQLAFKNTATGTYNQQRIEVSDHNHEALWALVKDGLVGRVNYLYWDDENKQHVTLKVSHESFIRGWSRFRRLADEEAGRFEQFLSVLKCCRDWLNKAGDLLSPKQLQRIDDARVTETLAEPRKRKVWLQRLVDAHGADEFAHSLRELGDFIRRSREAEKQATERYKRRLRAVAALAAALAVVVPVTTFAFLVQIPVAQRAAHFFKAAERANLARVSESYDSVGGAKAPLESLIDAARDLRAGQSDQSKRAMTADFLLRNPPLSWFDLRVGDLLPTASRTVEPMVNGRLRAVLTRAVWPTSPDISKGDGNVVIGAGGEARSKVDCSGLTGTLVPISGRRKDDPVKRGLFLSDHLATSGPGGGNRLVFGVTMQGPSCEVGNQLQALPVDRNPAVLFDATLQYMLLAVDGDPGQPPSVSVQRIDWEDAERGECASIQSPITVVFGPAAAESVRAVSGATMGQAKATWRMPGGRAFSVGNQGWWLISETATQLVPKPDDSTMIKLQEADTDRYCSAVKEAVKRDDDKNRQEGFTTRMYRDRLHCLAITRGVLPTQARAPVAAGGRACGTRSDRDNVFIRVYSTPRDKDLEELKKASPVAIASFQFGHLLLSEENWMVGRPGSRYEGWLALRREDERGVRYIGAPWSTEALMQLGKRVLGVPDKKPGDPPPKGPTTAGYSTSSRSP